MKRKMSDDIIDRVIQYILDNHLQEGDRLPSEQVLAGVLRIGRSTLREAMKALAARRIVEIRHGSGMYVTGLTGLADDPLGLLFIDDKMKLMEDLTAIRFMIEPQIAAMAAANATDEDIKNIHAIHREVNELIYAGQNHMEKDMALHTAIALSSKNTVVPRLIPIIHSAITMFIGATRLALANETAKVHSWIVEAIADHDPVAAQDAMQVHLVLNRRDINARLKNAGRVSSPVSSYKLHFTALSGMSGLTEGVLSPSPSEPDNRSQKNLRKKKA